MAFQRIPFLTRSELKSILDRTERLDSGCLIYHPDHNNHNPNLVVLRGKTLPVTRVVFAEHYAHTSEMIRRLDENEVVHKPECPHTGDYTGAGRRALCIEPTHLMLGDCATRVRVRTQRRTTCQRV